MKGLTRLVLVLGILFICVQCVSAWTASQVSVEPAGDLTPGSTVNVKFTIVFPTSGTETFPSSGTLDLLTELDSPKWSAVLVLNNIDNPQPLESKKNVYLTGWILSYPPSEYEETVRVTLEGTVPSVSTVTNKTLIRIQELDRTNNVVSGSTVMVSRLVINPGDVPAAIASRQSDLQSFRTHIDEKAALEIDTAEAEQKYSAAQAAINDAQAKPASQYTAAMASLANAQTLMTDGEKLLNKAWAEKDVSDAQVPITKTDELITWLTPNATSGEYKSKLSEIKTTREIAAGMISTANDEIFSGNYDRAREKATEAYTKGNESYNSALDLKKQLGQGFSFSLPKLPGGSFLIIAVVVVIVIGAVGYVIYRKRTQWDELG